ncbi:MAG TPA: hypothetical protein VGG99_06855 [Acetobacteraceae bacterium]|jgi:hypothetical protein
MAYTIPRGRRFRSAARHDPSDRPPYAPRLIRPLAAPAAPCAGEGAAAERLAPGIETLEAALTPGARPPETIESRALSARRPAEVDA